MSGLRGKLTLALAAVTVVLAANLAIAADPPLRGEDFMARPTQPLRATPLDEPLVAGPPAAGPAGDAGPCCGRPFFYGPGAAFLPPDGPNFTSAGPFPPTRFITYPKNPCPKSPWYFLTEGVALKREATDRTFAVRVERDWDLVFPLDENGQPDYGAGDLGWDFTETRGAVLGTQDLDNFYSGGGRAVLGLRLGEWYGIEVSYMGLNTWDNSVAFTDGGLIVPVPVIADTGVPVYNDNGFFDGIDEADAYTGRLFPPFSDFGNPPILGLDYNNLGRIEYFSRMQDVQWHLRRTICMEPELLQMSLLVGGRYMNIDEGFDYYSKTYYPPNLLGGVLRPNQFSENTVNILTENDMLGVQIGALFEFRVEPWWWIDTEIKGAVFDNRASMSNAGHIVTPVATTNVDEEVTGYTNAAPRDVRGSRSQHVTTWALDLNLTLNWQINRWLTGEIGYQALWIEGVALASENFETDIDMLTSKSAQLYHNGNVVYHGPHIGISGAW